MLATLGALPVDDDAWAYEFKWDGMRAVSYVDGGRIHVESRNGNDLTTSFPELRALGEQLGSRRVVLDGEIVAFDEDGTPSVPTAAAPDPCRRTPHKAKRLAAEQPVVYMIFDVLYIDGASLIGLPYVERRRRLEGLGLVTKKTEHWTSAHSSPGPGPTSCTPARPRGSRES